MMGKRFPQLHVNRVLLASEPGNVAGYTSMLRLHFGINDGCLGKTEG